MQISYDKKTDILTIRLSYNPPVESEYIEEKGVVLGYDKNNNIVALEIFDWSKKNTIDLSLQSKFTVLGS